MKVAAVGTWATAACLTVVIVACGSSGNTTASPTTTQATSSPTTLPVQTAVSSSESSSSVTMAPASVAPASTAPPAAVVGTVGLAFTGDLNSALTPDPSGPTCGQTGPQSVVLRGDAGGHNGSLALTSDAVGAVQFPSDHVASADYLPDGVGGSEYRASTITGAGAGSLTFNADGSGSVDLEIPFVAGTFSGTAVHVTGTWTC